MQIKRAETGRQREVAAVFPVAACFPGKLAILVLLAQVQFLFRREDRRVVSAGVLVTERTDHMPGPAQRGNFRIVADEAASHLV